MAYIDVDHLKTINDTRRHFAGDQMLVQVATALRAQIRSHNLVIRVGGDEFVCVVASLQLEAVADRLAEVNITLSTSPQPGSVSVGLVQLRPEDTPADLVNRADTELYRVRRTARSSTAADPSDPEG